MPLFVLFCLFYIVKYSYFVERTLCLLLQQSFFRSCDSRSLSAFFLRLPLCFFLVCCGSFSIFLHTALQFSESPCLSPRILCAECCVFLCLCSGLEKLYALQHLDLSRNRIASMADAACLTQVRISPLLELNTIAFRAIFTHKTNTKPHVAAYHYEYGVRVSFAFLAVLIYHFLALLVTFFVSHFRIH